MCAITGSSRPPRVLLVLPDQWPRALLRAALREVGYDAVGATGLAAALRSRAESRDRGPVRVVLLDQAVLEDEDSAARLQVLLRRHGHPVPMLLARTTPASPLPAGGIAVPWGRVIRRPVSIADLVAEIQTLLPLPPGSDRPID
jgi:DNA-binding response OmpR family regulator